MFQPARLFTFRLTHTHPARPTLTLYQHHHPFTTSPTHPKKPALPPRPTVPISDTTKNYLKGSGPGGQKINKTSSAVQLTHTPTGIVVKSQATRSRTQNESIARRLLAEKVEWLEKGSESRVEKKRMLESRKRRSGEKKRRRKYRALEGEEEKGEEDAEGVELVEGQGEEVVEVGEEGTVWRYEANGEGKSIF